MRTINRITHTHTQVVSDGSRYREETRFHYLQYCRDSGQRACQYLADRRTDWVGRWVDLIYPDLSVVREQRQLNRERRIHRKQVDRAVAKARVRIRRLKLQEKYGLAL